MAIPTIDPTSSILAAVVGQQLTFQPRASDTPTGWSLTSGGLPTGVTLNTTTGKVTGAPAEAGVFAFGLKATNGSGTSPEVTFAMGVERIAFASDSSFEIDIDLATGKVSNAGNPNAYPLQLTNRDRVRVSVGFVKNGVLQDLPISLLTIALTEYAAGEPALILNAGNVVKVGDYDATRYQVLLELDDLATQKALDAVLSNNEQDVGAWFIASTQVEWIEVAEVYLGAGEEDLRRTSKTFMSVIHQDLANAEIVPEPIE